MTTDALQTRTARERFGNITAPLKKEDPGIPGALGFLFACAASLAAWAMILGAAGLVLGKFG